jgi:rRNA maturation RNase YbeY
MTEEFPIVPDIDFFSESIAFSLDNQEEIASWLDVVFYKEGHQYGQINFIFCSDDYLLDINKTHLDHHFYTDVITFCLSEDPIEADIFISIDRVKENATSFLVAFEHELCRVMIHGILHCMGYEDKTVDLKKEMRKREDLYLDLFVKE